jgi:hypothetical protein
MALNSGQHRPALITNTTINDHLGLAPGLPGLEVGQIVRVITEVGGLYVDVIDCSLFNSETYLSVLASVIESGDRALLVFSTSVTAGGGAVDHVVSVFGHTLNSDAWHPQALPAYAGPSSASYYPSSNWISHFIIHDDNFGPYYTLRSQALDTLPSVKAKLIIAIRTKNLKSQPHFAAGLASTYLSLVLPSMQNIGAGRWLDYLTHNRWLYVLRTILIDRQDYLIHVTDLMTQVGVEIATETLASLVDLPDYFWMVEFSLPALFTGNKAKLGEVLIRADETPTSTDNRNFVLAMRLPGVLLLKDAASGQMQAVASSLDSHSPMYRARMNDNEW